MEVMTSKMVVYREKMPKTELEAGPCGEASGNRRPTEAVSH